jgi:hypothetical protein
MAIGLPSGEVLEEFEIEHRLEGFRDFFPRIEKHNPKQGYSVAVRISCSSGVDVPFTCRCWTAAKPCLSAFWLPGGPDLPRMPAMISQA